MTFYHPNPEQFAEICQRIFPYTEGNYLLARRTVSIPALLDYAGYPLVTNQFCFRHGGHGRALWTFCNEQDEWFFKCMDSSCGIKGDVVGMWYLMVRLSGFAPSCWNMDQACGDLMTRAKRGMIDLSVADLEDSRLSAQYPRPAEDYESYLRLEGKVREAGLPVFQGECSLPRHGVQISIRQAVTAMFPDDGLLLITPKPGWQSCNIFMRDEWLSTRYREACKCSYMSSNYLSRADRNCSYEGMSGITRRWLIIEGDEGTLEQQLWIHKQLDAQYDNLGCLLYSGGKSLHGWYFVEGWTEEQRYRLFCRAIDLGIRDINTWRICQPVRLPNGWNNTTQRKQLIIRWKLTSC